MFEIEDEEDDEEYREESDGQKERAYRLRKREKGIVDELAGYAVRARLAGEENPARFARGNDAFGREVPAGPFVDDRVLEQFLTDGRKSRDKAFRLLFAVRQEGRLVAEPQEALGDEPLNRGAGRDVEYGGSPPGTVGIVKGEAVAKEVPLRIDDDARVRARRNGYEGKVEVVGLFSVDLIADPEILFEEDVFGEGAEMNAAGGALARIGFAARVDDADAEYARSLGDEATREVRAVEDIRRALIRKETSLNRVRGHEFPKPP